MISILSCPRSSLNAWCFPRPLIFPSRLPPQSNFGNIYEEDTPQSYVQTLVPIDYGHYHDRYTEMVCEEIAKLYKASAERVNDNCFPDTACKLVLSPLTDQSDAF